MTISYAIHCDPCYYAGAINVAKPGLVCAWMETKAITLADKAAADLLAIMLNDAGSGPYELSHGQYAAPQHEVRETALPVRYTLAQAMRVLDLHYDFAPDGSRLQVPSPF
jgi:hypothetical protein